jgi:hypothetical protein
VGGSADLIERPPAVLAEPLEAGELRLDGHACRPRHFDQALALLVDGDRGALGDVAEIALGCSLRRQGTRIWIKPKADLAAALLDEGREPIDEGARLVSRCP